MLPMSDGISREELQLAARNHGMPLEALRYDITPAGLHYLLIHYDIPEVDLATWRLEVTGAVDRPLSVDLDDLRQRPAVTAAVTLECAGNGRVLYEPRPVSQPWVLEAVGTARWTGLPVRELLEQAGVADDAVEVTFAGLDRGIEGEVEQTYERGLPLAEAMRPELLLAYGMNGQPLPPQHGSPLRLVVPGWYGMTSVKWLTRIEVLREPFSGYQNARGYRFRLEEEDAVGEPVTRIAPRSLMVPPGIPEFLSRSRIVDAGPVEVRGRAWSGGGAIERVAFSDGGGETWSDAVLDEAGDPFAWRGWTFRWNASPGERILSCRATDETGESQPLEATWNVGGYRNNAVQRVPVLVR